MLLLHLYETQNMCSLIIWKIGVNIEVDYAQYSYNLKENNQNYSLYCFKMIIRSISLMKVLIYISKKLATVVEGDPKAPFSIATAPRYRGRRYSFPGLLHFSLINGDLKVPFFIASTGKGATHFLGLLYLPLIHTLYCWMLSKEVSDTIFESLVWFHLELNPYLTDH